MVILLMAIGGYFDECLWLLMNIILVATYGYFINGYWWIFY
jgi:hypothetical protein